MTSETIEKVTFWDYTGRGDYQMIAAIRSAAAVTIYKFEAAINYSNRKGVMSRDDEVKSYLLGSTQITTFTVAEDFLIVGCMTCGNNRGWLSYYTTDTLRLRKKIVGSDKNGFVGKHVETRHNMAGMSQLWYSSRYKEQMFLSAVHAFKDPETEAWSFDEQS